MGLVILALFLLISLILLMFERRLSALMSKFDEQNRGHNEIMSEIQESKSDIVLQVERVKNCVLKFFFDEGILTDQRKRRQHVKDERRTNDGTVK